MNARTRITRDNLITRELAIRSSLQKRLIFRISLKVFLVALLLSGSCRLGDFPVPRGDASRKSSGRLVPCPEFVQKRNSLEIPPDAMKARYHVGRFRRKAPETGR